MKYRVITDHPVATDSRDHTHPAGTKCDNSRNGRFNQRLYALFPGMKIRACDLGCSGGGFVKDLLDAGHDAIGIEGSDYSLQRKRAEWATISNNLFTADITRPFEVIREYAGGEKSPELGYYDPNVLDAEERALFDVVTAWEVMEHIPEDRLPQLIENVKAHLAPGGIWVMSVSIQRGFHHVTVQPKPWWEALFARHGLVHDEQLRKHFRDEWVRGPDHGAPESFHLVLKRSA